MARIGVVGCGNISGVYLDNLAGRGLAAVFDLDPARSARAGETHGVTQARSLAELCSQCDLVANLTPPSVHEQVSMEALLAGCHVYSEKPLATSYAGAVALMEAAASRSVALGCAPDTVLGAGVQACRQALDSGILGTVSSGSAAMLCPGHESWHPDPEFYYKPGGGPLWDMGPYYLSALVVCLGPVAWVQSVASTPRAVRTIGSGPRAGEEVAVEVPTTLLTLLEFASGPVVSLSTSFDVCAHSLPHIELYGSFASLRAPDPNGFGGSALLSGPDGWHPLPFAGETGNARGLGVLEMAEAVAQGREPRCSASLGAHVVEVVELAHRSAATGQRQRLESRPARPKPFLGVAG